MNRLDFADTTEDMDPSRPDVTLASKSRGTSAREPLAAADTEQVAGWVDALVRAIEGRRKYPGSEPVLQKLHADLEVATRSCLNQIGELTIGVEEFDLNFDGRCVYHSAAREGSLANALYRDGMRELIIRQGLEPDELIAFVEILQCAIGESEEGSEGVANTVWERGIGHIECVCIPLEEWEPEPGPEAGRGSAPGDDAGIPWPAGIQEVRETGSGASEQAEVRADDWSLRASESSPRTIAPGALPEFTETEANNLIMLAKIEEVLSPRDRVMEIVSAALAAEENPQEFLDLASIVTRLVGQAVRDGDLEGANHLLDRLESVSRAKEPAPGEFRAAVDRVLLDLGGGELLGQLGKLLDRNRSIDLGALASFLARLGPTAAPALCDLLGEVAEMKVRRAICEALAVSCKNDVNILIERLSDRRWFVVRNILYILGRIAHQGVERALGDALYHSDVRVRRESVRAIGGLKSPTSRAYLNSALRDPDKTVRKMVAGALAERNDERAARILWGVIESPEFPTRDSDERIAFFEALGATGCDALVPRLEQTLTRGGLFQSRNLEGRTEAAMALAWLGTPAALAVLRREMNSRKDEVRRAVTEALETLRKSTPRKPSAGWDDDPPSGAR